jgi:hypothetical protein
LATLSCPRCHQPIDSQAIACPHCHSTLKAYGHPGIPLYQSQHNEYLCDNCLYHYDDSCNFSQRPYAQDCTLYQNIEEHNLEIEQQRRNNSLIARITLWLKRYQGLVLIMALLLICLFITVLNQ